jgi:hypothetical protein
MSARFLPGQTFPLVGFHPQFAQRILFLRLLPFLFSWVRNRFGAMTLNQLGISKIVCSYVFQEVSFSFLFFAFFAIILTFVFLNFAKILSFSSLRDLTLSTPQTKSRFFEKK